MVLKAHSHLVLTITVPGTVIPANTLLQMQTFRKMMHTSTSYTGESREDYSPASEIRLDHPHSKLFLRKPELKNRADLNMEDLRLLDLDRYGGIAAHSYSYTGGTNSSPAAYMKTPSAGKYQEINSFV
jgi:hypothetical protein